MNSKGSIDSKCAELQKEEENLIINMKYNEFDAHFASKIGKTQENYYF